MSDSAAAVVDLHTHSTASDGQYTPTELLAEAKRHGVTVLAITDHDTVAGFESIRDVSAQPVHLVSGIELSVIWRRRTIHVVGLDIDTQCEAITTIVAQQQNARRARAERIANRLARGGIADTLAEAQHLAGPQAPGRPHFAEVLVARGVVRDRRAAFRRWLGDGKPAACSADWVNLEDAIRTIHAAGGISVLAHPLGYRLTKTKLAEMVADFAAADGTAVELYSGAQNPEDTFRIARLATKYELDVSVGTDFHQPGNQRNRLGQQFSIPDDLRPVWARLSV